MKSVLLMVIAASALLSLTGCQNLGDKVTLTETAQIDQTKVIDIDVSAGDVDIIREDRDDVYVEFTTFKNGEQLEVNGGETLRIKTYNDNNAVFRVNGKEYKMTVRIPDVYEYSLNVDTSSGYVRMSDFVLKELSCNLSSGNLTLTRILAEEIDVDMSSGDATFDDVEAKNMTFNLSSGYTELKNITGNIKGDSSSGDVSIQYKETMSDLEYNLSSGKISVDYSNVKELNGNFEVSVSSGKIKNSLPLDDMNLEEDYLNGSVGDKMYDILLETTSGDIELIR